MPSPSAQPGTRFLRVARKLALVSGIAAPLFVAVGCSSSSGDASNSDAAYDGGPLGIAADTNPIPDSPFDGIVTGTAPLDTGTGDVPDADATDTRDAATEGGLPGGPGRAPEMPEMFG